MKDTKICGKGCALTALTMLLNFYGVETDVLLLNDWLIANGGYTDGDVKFDKILKYPGLPFTSFSRLDKVNKDVLNSEIRQGKPVIVKIPGSGASHFVVVFCKSGSIYKFWDPDGGKVGKISGDQMLGLRIFR